MLNCKFRHFFLSLMLALFSCSCVLAQAGRGEFQKAEALRKQRRYEEAVSAYEKAISAEPNNTRYLFGSAKNFYSMKNWEMAIGNLNDLNAIQPNSNAYALLAKIHIIQKEYDQAAGAYDLAAEASGNDPRKARYLIESSKIYLKQKNVDAAEQRLVSAQSIDPQNLNVAYMVAKISNQKEDYTQAKASIENIEGTLDGMPPAQSAKFYYEYGYAKYKSGDLDGADKEWKNASSIPIYRKKIMAVKAQDSPVADYRKAAGYYLAGLNNDCESSIQEALSKQNNFAPAFSLQARLEKKRGNYSKAISSYQSALNLTSDPQKQAKIYLSLGRLQLDAEDYSGALNSFNQYLTMKATDVNVNYFKALSQYHLGQYVSAVSTLEAVMSQANLPPKMQAQFNLLMGLAAKNTDIDKAKEAFEAAAKYSTFRIAAMKHLKEL